MTAGMLCNYVQLASNCRKSLNQSIAPSFAPDMTQNRNAVSLKATNT
jgi:hypothetical protein